jgi:oligoendopeptidase F
MSRNYIPESFNITTWELLLPYYEKAIDFPINSADEFDDFLKYISELESMVSEDLAWRYIKMTCDTNNEELEKRYVDFVNLIQPHIAPFEDKINQKIHQSPYKSALEKEKSYFIYFRSIANSIQLYREENVPLFAEIQTLSQKYGSITGSMSVEIDGKVLTLQQASNILKEPNRERRQMAYEKIQAVRFDKVDELNGLFNELIQLRHQVAKNSGFNDFRDYMHQAMGRFDYSVQDCFDFHAAIEQQVVPLLKKIESERKNTLGYESLQPYDLAVDPSNRPALKPFETGAELLEKTIQCFTAIDSEFGENLMTMKQKGFLDLESRLGKAPGGYNYPLAESGVPFIFMNAAGSLRDVETMVHEGGHAMHSFLTEHLSLNAFKNAPMEVAEVASMSMELLSMDTWNAFFDNEGDLKRAKIEQLEGVIATLPWIATIDAFQHWIYTHPQHTIEERVEAWKKISHRFDTGVTDYSKYQLYLSNSWQKQLHLYEVPFYYIEYGFAQLGAIAIWRNFKKDKVNGLMGYKNLLSKGYTVTIPELFEAGGVKFDFSSEYVGELFQFVWDELEQLKKN